MRISLRHLVVIAVAFVSGCETAEVRQQKSTVRQTTGLQPVTRAQVFVLGGIQDDADAPGFAVHPYNKTASILADTELTGDAAESLAAIWRSRHFEGDGVLCHYPVYGLRLYSDDDMVLETSLCWECSSCFIADGSGGHQWQGFYDNDYVLLRRLLDVLEPPDHIRSAISVEIGSSLYMEDRYAEAVDELSLAISLDSSNHNAYSWRSKTYATLGKLELAISDLTDGMPHAPEWLRRYSLSMRGELLASTGKHDLAVQDFTDAIAITKAEDDKLQDLYLQRAASYDQLGKSSEAGQDRRDAELQ